MILFYTTDIKGNQAILNNEEARHCTQVLRKKIGDKIHFVDGLGTLYEAIIVEIGKKKCVLDITHTHSNYTPRNFYLHIAIAPTKSMERLEWFVEKSTEIGVDEITPIICQHSERRKLRTDRLVKKAISAMKQSLKATLPIINPPISLYEALQYERYNSLKFIAHSKESNALWEHYSIGEDAYLLIGPEGDFSKAELQQSFGMGFKGVNIGKSRFRTETAGIVACQTLNFLNETKPSINL